MSISFLDLRLSVIMFSDFKETDVSLSLFLLRSTGSNWTGGIDPCNRNIHYTMCFLATLVRQMLEEVQ